MSATLERETTSSPSAVRLTVLRRTHVRGTPVESHLNVHHERTNHYALQIPLSPVTFVFARQRLGSGLRSLAAGVFGTGIGAFLATQIAATPNLRVQVTIVSVICVLLGLVMLHFAVRDLLGRLRVDSRGIQLSPGYQGFSIAWTDLQEWNIDGMAFHFRSLKSKGPVSVDLEVLQPTERLQLRGLLLACAPDRELTQSKSSRGTR